MSPIIWLNYNFFFFLSLEGFALKLPKGSKREIPKNKGKWRYRRIQCLSIQPLHLQLCVFYTHPKYSVMSPRSLLGQLYHHGWVGVATVFEWISCPGPWERIYTLNNRRWLDQSLSSHTPTQVKYLGDQKTAPCGWALLMSCFWSRKPLCSWVLDRCTFTPNKYLTF